MCIAEYCVKVSFKTGNSMITHVGLPHGRATSGPGARSGPRRPSVRPATLIGKNIAIRPAKPLLSQQMPGSWAKLRVAHTKDALHHSPRGFVCQLPAKSLNVVGVVSVVVKVVNSILSRSLNHRQFQALVDEVDVQYGVCFTFAKFVG